MTLIYSNSATKERKISQVIVGMVCVVSENFEQYYIFLLVDFLILSSADLFRNRSLCIHYIKSFEPF